MVLTTKKGVKKLDLNLLVLWHICLSFLAATKQLYEWFSPSVCPSVRLSVRHTFLTMYPSSHHHEIVRSYYQWQKWRPSKNSRSEVKGQGHRGKKIGEIDPDWVFPDCDSSLNSRMATKWWTKLEVAWKRCPIGFRSGFSRREISGVYLWWWWQRTKIERRNSMRKMWLKCDLSLLMKYFPLNTSNRKVLPN